MTSKLLDGKTALVTGSSRGIGRAIAVAFAEAGANVAINYVNDADAAASAVSEILALGRQAVAFQADVGEPEMALGLVNAVTEELGRIDVLVNNAGIGGRVADPRDLTLEQWTTTLNVNLTSAFVLTDAVLPSMRERQWGRIINISSTAAQTGGSIGPHYAASKAGIIGLTHGYAKMLVKEGITVNAIAMAQIDTDLVHSSTPADPSRIPVGRLGSTSEISDVATLLATNAYITGQTLSVNGGMYFTS
jgi:3-oxoacyl-[acyl-carrier protein] reductase